MQPTPKSLFLVSVSVLFDEARYQYNKGSSEGSNAIWLLQSSEVGLDVSWQC